MTVVIHIVGVVLENGLLTTFLRVYMRQEAVFPSGSALGKFKSILNIAFPSFIKYSGVFLLLSLYRGKAFKVSSRSSEKS